MRRANIISGLVLCAVSIVMMGAVIPWQIDPGPAGMMSPRLVPNLMMALILGLSLVMILSNLRRGAGGAEGDDKSPFARAELGALLRIAGVFAVSILLFEFVAPLAGGIALVVGGLLVLGERRLLVIVLMTSVLLTSLWALFYKLLGTAIL